MFQAKIELLPCLVLSDRYFREIGIPKTFFADLACFIDEECSWRELLHSLPNRERCRNIVERKIHIERADINLFLRFGVEKYCLWLRSKQKRVVKTPEVEGFLPHAIAGEQ